MNYSTKSILTIVFLFAAFGIIGIIISVGNGGSSFFGKTGKIVGASGVTGAVFADTNCTGNNCQKTNETCQGYACKIACYQDKDCDDRIEQTDDICRNPGTTYSLCVNRVRK